MIEYPECHSGDCWYKGNTDRLNEYCDSTPLVVNADTRTRFDTADCPPMIVQLCDVCIDNEDLGFNTRCEICQIQMYDQWITLGRGDKQKHYCRVCVDEEQFEGELLECWEGEEMKIEKLVAHTWKEGELPNRVRTLMEKQVLVCIEQRKKEKTEKKRKRREREAKTVQLLQKWVPALTEECASRVTKRLAVEAEPPKLESADSFVEWLISL